MGISGNMQSLSQLCACYGVPRVTRGFTTLFIGETFAVWVPNVPHAGLARHVARTSTTLLSANKINKVSLDVLYFLRNKWMFQVPSPCSLSMTSGCLTSKGKCISSIPDETNNQGLLSEQLYKSGRISPTLSTGQFSNLSQNQCYISR